MAASSSSYLQFTFSNDRTRSSSSSDAWNWPLPTSTASTEEEVNAYDVLGVDVTASHRAVRDAFRQKAKDAHPDRGGTPEAFDALKRAQDVLTDDGKRAALDARWPGHHSLFFGHVGDSNLHVTTDGQAIGGEAEAFEAIFGTDTFCLAEAAASAMRRSGIVTDIMHHKIIFYTVL